VVAGNSHVERIHLEHCCQGTVAKALLERQRKSSCLEAVFCAPQFPEFTSCEGNAAVAAVSRAHSPCRAAGARRTGPHCLRSRVLRPPPT
jgi:hypothetical protein